MNDAHDNAITDKEATERFSKAPAEVIPVLQSRFQAPAEMADYVPQAVHNFTGSPRDVWRLTAVATGPACGRVEDSIGKPIAVKHVYIQVIKDFEGAGGEVKDALRTVLIDADGKAYATMSIVVAQEAFNMLKSFGNMPFDPPIDIQFAESRTRSGAKMFSIVPV